MCFSGGPRFGPGPTKCRTADTGQRVIFVIAPSWPYPTTIMSINKSVLRRSRATVIRRPPPTEIIIHFRIGRIRRSPCSGSLTRIAKCGIGSSAFTCRIRRRVPRKAQRRKRPTSVCSRFCSFTPEEYKGSEQDQQTIVPAHPKYSTQRYHRNEQQKWNSTNPDQVHRP